MVSRLFDWAQRRMQLHTDLHGTKFVTRNDARLAQRISEFHIFDISIVFGISIVALCLTIVTLAQKEYVQNTKITVA